MSMVSASKSIKFWDLPADEVTNIWWQHPASINAIAFNSNANRIVTSCDDKYARVFVVGGSARRRPKFEALLRTSQSFPRHPYSLMGIEVLSRSKTVSMSPGGMQKRAASRRVPGCVDRPQWFDSSRCRPRQETDCCLRKQWGATLEYRRWRKRSKVFEPSEYRHRFSIFGEP